MGERDTQLSRDTCVINQVALPLGMAPPTGREGFYYDTRPDPAAPDCQGRIAFTGGAGLVANATAVMECIQGQGTAPGAGGGS